MVETADVAALLRYSCTTLVHGEGLIWPGGGDSFEPLRVFHVFTRRVEGADEQERRGPEGSAVMDRGSGDTRSSDVGSVYRCKGWERKARLGRSGRRSTQRNEPKEEQFVQQSVVGAS